MAAITKFHENLFTAFKNSHKDIINRIWGQVFNDRLVVTVRKEKEGRCNCINASTLTIYPTGTHKMIVEEVVAGYDSDGSRWSDHMGGKVIDCTGKNVKGAIELIVAEMNNRI